MTITNKDFIDEPFILTDEPILTPVEEAEDPWSEVSRLNTEVGETQARYVAERERADRAERELQRFKDRVCEVGGHAAEEHDWCGVYDQLMEELGLPGRLKYHSVDIKVTYEFTVAVTARSTDDAEQMVRDADLNNTWRPGLPFAVGEEITAEGSYAHSVEIEVI